MAQIIWSELAKEQLREIDEYIAAGSPFYSIVFIDKMIAAVEKVGAFPQCGRVVPEFGKETLREVIFYDYRIVYSIVNEVVTIVAVVHGAMDIIRKRERETWDLT
jgi:plasmid stabilization system protein ParE